MMLEALKAQSEMEVGYVKKIAALKQDNRSLRRICGVKLLDESDDDEDEGNGVAGTIDSSSVRNASPELFRQGEGDEGADGRRVLIQ